MCDQQSNILGRENSLMCVCGVFVSFLLSSSFVTFTCCQDDEQSFVSRMINQLANYHGGIVPNAGQETAAGDDDSAGSGCKPKKKKKGAKKGVCRLSLFLWLATNFAQILIHRCGNAVNKM
jgi:hypothetical protein